MNKAELVKTELPFISKLEKYYDLKKHYDRIYQEMIITKIGQLDEPWNIPPELNMAILFEYLDPLIDGHKTQVPSIGQLLNLRPLDICLDIGFGGVLELDEFSAEGQVTYIDIKKFSVTSSKNNRIIYSSFYDIDGHYDKIFSQQGFGLYNEETILKLKGLLKPSGCAVFKSHFQTLQQEVLALPIIASKHKFKVNTQIFEGKVYVHKIFKNIKIQNAPTVVHTLTI